VTRQAVAVGRGPELVGRAVEQDRLYAFAEAIAAGPRALLLRGEPGIGKTMLWRYGVERCREVGFAVLVARPAEEDLPVALGGVVDLFEHDELDTDALRAADDPLARGRAVLDALRRLAARKPTVVAVDDLQWLDSASARALGYAFRHLDGERVGLLSTARPAADPGELPAPVASVEPAALEVIEIGPLSLRALRRMLEGTVASISRPALRRIHDASGGNPLFAIELARGLGGWVRIPGLTPVVEPPTSLQAAIAERVDRAPPELAPLLETASALGRTTTAELEEALPDTDVERLLSIAVEHELLVVEDDDVWFAHPLVSSVVYARLDPLERQRLHGRLAARTGDQDVRARHLALSADEADGEIAELLEAAARRAHARGAFDVAAELGRHSLRLTPADDTEAALTRALIEIEDLARSGEVGRAVELSDELIARLPSGPARARALMQHSDLEADDPAACIASLEQAFAEAGEVGSLRSRVLQELAFARFLGTGDLAGALDAARHALAILQRRAEPDLESLLLAESCLAHMEAVAGRPRPEVMAEAVRREGELPRAPLSWRPRILLSKQQRWAGELEAARTLREDGDASAENQRPYRLYDLALLECAAGDFAAAEELVREGLEAARDAGDGYGVRAFPYPLALLQAWLGRADHARATIAAMYEGALRLGERLDVVACRRVLGLLALSEGSLRTARDELVAAAGLLHEIGIAHPGLYPVLPDAVEVLARTGELEDAEVLLERLETQAAAVGSDWARAAAERSRGLVLLTQGDTDEAAPLLERAARSFDQLGHRPDAARATLGLGQALLRAGRRSQAAAALEDARRRFAEMGAVLWEATAVAELERSAPGRGSGELTVTERRIAALVARGRKNREIAQELLLTDATVEGHLTRIYAKLDVRSRSELARLFPEGEGLDRDV
jgi:DNA-binding NarL/FixJ family response regulator